MSASSLRTSIKRLSQAWIQPGHVVAIRAHTCQTEAELEALARQALGREWRPADVLIVCAIEGPCQTTTHGHEDPIIIYARGG